MSELENVCHLPLEPGMCEQTDLLNAMYTTNVNDSTAAGVLDGSAIESDESCDPRRFSTTILGPRTRRTRYADTQTRSIDRRKGSRSVELGARFDGSAALRKDHAGVVIDGALADRPCVDHVHPKVKTTL